MSLSFGGFLALANAVGKGGWGRGKGVKRGEGTEGGRMGREGGKGAGWAREGDPLDPQ